MSPVLHLNGAVVLQNDLQDGLEVLVPSFLAMARMTVFFGGERWYAIGGQLIAALHWDDRYRQWTAVAVYHSSYVSHIVPRVKITRPAITVPETVVTVPQTLVTS
jgi:hypothetical protein